MQLRRQYQDIAYVRTPQGYEVDFIVRNAQGEETLVQVCAAWEEQQTRERELRALADARQAYPRASLMLITLDNDETVEIGDVRVRATPVWRWALTK